MSESGKVSKTGGCLCGAVRYRITGPLRQIIACHCEQCRRMSGNYVVATAAYRRDISIEGEAAITWFSATPGFQRGFCGACGSHLFWDREGSETVSIYAGSLDQPSGLEVVHHIFVDDKADYTLIGDALPRHGQSGPGASIE